MNRLTRLILWWVIPAFALGQGSQKDSAKTYQAAEVVVTATRSAISQKDAPSPTEVLGSRELRNANGGTIADVLQTYTGILLKEYGAGAALRTVSLRGSASEHVLVLIDGNRYTSFQNGLVDLNLLPLADVERIEVLHGGASALYGADALGGVINILTRPAATDLSVKANGAAGSYGYRSYSARAQGGRDGLGVVAGYSHEQGQDNYPFVLHRINAPDTSLVRSDADFSREESFVNGAVRPDDRSSINLSVQNIFSSVGAPGDLFFAKNSSLDRQNDRDFNATAGYRDNHISGMELGLNTGFHYSFERFSSPGYDTYYKNRYFNINPNVQIALTTNDRLILGGEVANGMLDSFDFGNRITRRQYSVFASNEFVKDFDQEFFDRLSLYQTLRYDNISDVGSALTPKVGMNLRITRIGDVRVRASYGTSFRAPSLNDLYYAGANNPDLRSEHSQSLDFGFLADGSFYGEHAVELTYFYVNTIDRILFDPVSFIPFNVGKSVSQGVESSYSGRYFGGILEIGLNYTLTNTRKKNTSSPNDSSYDKQLIYIPQNLFKGMLTVHLNPVTFSLFRVFTGLRFVNDKNTRLFLGIPLQMETLQ